MEVQLCRDIVQGSTINAYLTIGDNSKAIRTTRLSGRYKISVYLHITQKGILRS